MKIDINLVGTPAALPDYEMLKAALLSAQASTPTARASREAGIVVPPHDALEQLFVGKTGSSEVASSLDNRFAREPDTSDDAA